MDALFLHAANDPSPQYWQATTAMRLSAAGEETEMMETTEATTRRRKDNEYQLQVTDRKTESNRDFFNWMAIINAALDDILVETDRSGTIVRLTIPGVKEQERRVEKALLEKYKKREGVREMLQQINHYLRNPSLLVPELSTHGWQSLLFPGLFGNYQVGESVCVSRIFSRFVFRADLPLAITRTLHETPDGYLLRGEGAIDQSRFDRKKMIAGFKELYDAYDIRISEKVDYEENFRFDKTGQMIYGDTYFSLQIPGCYRCDIARVVAGQNKDHEQQVRSRWVLPNLQ